MEFWNPYTETLPRDELDRIEFSYFKNIFSYAKNNSKLYKEKFKGIEPGDIKSIDDIRKIPFTYKEELRAQQENVEPFPYGGLLGVNIGWIQTQTQTVSSLRVQCLCSILGSSLLCRKGRL